MRESCRTTVFLSTRLPLTIAGSFICYCPEIDGRAPEQLDSTPGREPELQKLFVVSERNRSHIPKQCSGGESVEKHRRE
ncbi:hypothetical protein TNCV_3153191 [Trichonephila clavipes]|nr:hypothetical protein TNCV_3153191 [Trichonephila clavipes]